MARTQIKEVSGCKDCPFAVPGAGEYCSLHPARIDIARNYHEAGTLAGQLDGVPNYPPTCPLKELPVLLRLRHVRAKAGRPLPPVTPGRDFEAEVRHFRAWLDKQRGGLWIPITELAEESILGPALKIHHFRKALAGARPFYEAELDKAVAYAKKHQNYPGFPPPAQSLAEQDLPPTLSL